MKRLLATTALALMISGPVLATTMVNGDAARTYLTQPNGTDLFGSDFVGMRIHADTGAERQDIGEVSDVLLTRGGEVKAVLVDVGGFLGIGEKTVAIDMDRLMFESPKAGQIVLVVEGTRESLTQAPTFDREPPSTWRDHALFDAGWPEAPSIELDGYAEIDVDRLTAADLQNAIVYDAAGEDVGTVSELLVNANGDLEGAVIDVGGFLGWREHSVSVPFEKILILRDAEKALPRLYVDISKERLEKMPEFEG